MPLKLPTPDILRGSADPITAKDVPVASASSTTFHIAIIPVYKLPFAFQFKVKNSMTLINTMPLSINRLPEDGILGATILRRISGPLNDPTQQRRDDLEIMNPPAGAVDEDLLKEGIDRVKPESRKRYDVTVDVGVKK